MPSNQIGTAAFDLIVRAPALPPPSAEIARRRRPGTEGQSLVDVGLRPAARTWGPCLKWFTGGSAEDDAWLFINDTLQPLAGTVVTAYDRRGEAIEHMLVVEVGSGEPRQQRKDNAWVFLVERLIVLERQV